MQYIKHKDRVYKLVDNNETFLEVLHRTLEATSKDLHKVATEIKKPEHIERTLDKAISISTMLITKCKEAKTEIKLNRQKEALKAYSGPMKPNEPHKLDVKG